MDSRSRLPSITHLQEKLRKRWPRTMRVVGSGGGGGGGGGGGEGRERSHKYWRTAPRLVSVSELRSHVCTYVMFNPRHACTARVAVYTYVL